MLLAEVADFDLDARELHLRSVAGGAGARTARYDTLIVAGGSHYSYFGHDEWRRHAAEVKSLESALAVRSRLLAAFEAAELEPDPERRATRGSRSSSSAPARPASRWPARSPSSRATRCAATSARSIRARGRILLVEAADRVLTSFPPSLSAKAARSLQRLGVTVLTGRTVIGDRRRERDARRPRRRRGAHPQPHRRLGRRRHRLRPRRAGSPS